MRLRVKFEQSLLSSAACIAGLQRTWFCAPATLRTVSDLAAALVERFGVSERHDKLVLAAGGYTLPPDTALVELLCDSDRVTVTRPRSKPRTEALASKRSLQRGIVTGTNSDSDLDGNELLGVTLSPPIGALALRHGGAHTSVRSRSARRKALKRARRRHMTNKVAKSTPSPPPTAAAAPPPPVIGWPASDAVHARAQVAAKSGSDSGDSGVDAAMQDLQDLLTPAKQVDARYAEHVEDSQAFQLWVAGISSDAEGEPCSDTSALRVGDVITYRIVELSAAGIPQISPRRPSSVSVVSSDDGVVVLVPHPEAARLGGLSCAAEFAAAGIMDVEDASHSLPVPPHSPDGSLQVAFSELLHVRHCLLPDDGLLRAGTFAPDAATALSASAAALAAARMKTAAGKLVSVHLESESLEPGAATQPAAADGACVVASDARAAAPVPAAPRRTTRAVVRGGGVAGALARLRREAAKPAA